MFTKTQLEFLIDTRCSEDLAPNYFAEKVLTSAYDFEEMSDIEYEELINLFNSFSNVQIAKLQHALSILGDI